jgi:hypothetical protein
MKFKNLTQKPIMTKLIHKTLLLSTFICLTYGTYAQTLPLPDHIVIIIEENHAVPSVIGHAAAPYCWPMTQIQRCLPACLHYSSEPA